MKIKSAGIILGIFFLIFVGPANAMGSTQFGSYSQAYLDRQKCKADALGFHVLLSCRAANGTGIPKTAFISSPALGPFLWPLGVAR